LRIPDEIFDEILRTNDIVDVISSYISVKRRGNSYLALCPFHPDKNPSMHISQTKQVYHCFSCKAGGNVITFVQEYEKISSMEAVERLASRIGINLGKFSQYPDLSNAVSKLFEINTIAAKYFYNNLKNLGGDEKEFIDNYLSKRGLSRNVITEFGIGYSRDQWHHLENYFIENEDFTNDELESAGLLIKSEKDGKYHDRFRGRLMFPILNESGKVVGFGGRILKDDEDTAKYINSPETKVYQKSKLLFGLNFAKDHIRSQDFVILVEGYMDVVSLFDSGIRNVVASSGTSLTTEQVMLISRYTKNIVLIYDGDLAGIKASKRGIDIILEQGLEINVVNLPEEEDPDSYVKKYGVEAFQKEISKKKNIITFLSDVYEKEKKLNTPEEKTEFTKEIISYLVKIPDKIKISFYVKELAKKFSIYESDLRDELNRAYIEYKKTAFPKSSVVLPVSDKKISKITDKKTLQAEIDLLRILIQSDNAEAIEYLVNNIYIDYISNAEIAIAVTAILDQYHNEGNIDIAKIMNNIENEEAKELILNESIPKYTVLKSDFLPKDTIYSSIADTKIDYLKIAVDTIKVLRKKSINRKIRNSIKDPKKHSEGLKYFDEKKRLGSPPE